MTNAFDQPENIVDVLSFEVPTEADELLTILQDPGAYIESIEAAQSKLREIEAKTSEAAARVARGVYEDERLGEAIDAMKGAIEAETTALVRAMETMPDRVAREWLEGEESEPPKWQEKYPLETEEGGTLADATAREAFIEALELLKAKYGKAGKDGKLIPATTKDAYKMLGVESSQYYNYISGKSRVPRRVCEKLCGLLGIGIDELRRGDFSGGATSDGTTVERLLTLDVWEAEHVAEVYARADVETKRAVTHALKTWLTLNTLVEKWEHRDRRDSIAREVLKDQIADLQRRVYG